MQSRLRPAQAGLLALTLALTGLVSGAEPAGIAGDPGGLRGRFALPDGQPLGAIRLQLTRDEESVAETSTGADGGFEFSGLGAGIYGIHVSLPMPPGAPEDFGWSCPAAGSMGEGLPVEGGKSLDLGTLVVRRIGYDVRVRVTQDGEPVPGVEISLWIPGLRVRRFPALRSGADGIAHIRVRDLDPSMPAALFGVWGTGAARRMSPPQRITPRPWTAETVELRLPKRFADRIVRVRWDDGGAASGASVLLLSPDPTLGWSLCNRGTVSPDGLCKVRDLPEGDFRVAVGMPGGAWQVFPASHLGDDRPTDVRLARGRSLTLSLRLNVVGRPLAEVMRRLTEKGAPRLPSFGVFLIPEGSREPVPWVPVAVVPGAKTLEPIRVSGVVGNRMRALACPMDVLESDEEDQQTADIVASQHSQRAAEGIRVIGGQLALRSADFDTSGGEATLTGDSDVESLAAASADLPPYVAVSPLSLRGLLAALGRD